MLAICVAFTWTTRGAMANLPFLGGGSANRGHARADETIVDLSPWQTAQALAALAVSAEEGEYAREAERLADHEVDQAFASALRQAGTEHPVLTGAALTLSHKVAQLQKTVEEDQQHLQNLTRAANPSTKPKAGEPIPSANDLDVAKAQLGLDSDELSDAQRDLARASGDRRTRIQQELNTHEAAMSKYDAQVRSGGEVAVLSARHYNTLAGRVRAWFQQRSRYQLLQQAMSRAQAGVSALTAEHNLLEAQANAGSSPGGSEDLASLKSRSTQRQILSIYDDRIETEQQLATTYRKWGDQVLLQHRIVVHLILQSFAMIAFILICVILGDALLIHWMERPVLDRRRMQTLRTILGLGSRMTGALLILLVVFGAPQQMSTVLGLATAGLTVALQAYILAFFGWFVLMGKNGIRVGDWVEINGVGGEVVEISLFRTTMLETGNWTDKGHPTGRRVTFINNFAVSGQYFNFSTTGQWLWDELSVSIPTSDDTYALIECIHKAVLKETADETRLAEQEWKRVTRKNGLSQFSASPAVNLRPAGAGIDIVVRYVTRASDRFEVRNRIYERVIEVLHKPLTLPRERPDASDPQGIPALTETAWS
ncbi:MAG TPA: mechanosensitive ion channel domain-containing protein [Acidobacteriaceae bacterium]|nr:mechanosensitive ion channel domain-containing protein [Acidobacteriaceae bacterium]